ncbi:MAG: hypothetical protein GY895_09310 [Phycisphaera sp.]|nr:hypothetical protein [Phycisphaera sp.]
MADQNDKGREDAQDDGDRKSSRKGGRVGLLTVVLLVVEAAAIGGGFMMFSSPNQTEADGMSIELDEVHHEVVLEEVVIFEGNLGNESTGVALRYPTRVFFKVDARDRLWIEAEASRLSGTIHAQLAEIWKLAARRELESPNLAAVEARIKRSFEQEKLFERRPATMALVSGVDDPAGHESDHEDPGSEADSSLVMPDGAIVHDVIVVMDIGRRVHR